MRTDKSESLVENTITDNKKAIKTLMAEINSIKDLIERSFIPLRFFYWDTSDKKQKKIGYLETLNIDLNRVLNSLKVKDQTLEQQLQPIQAAYQSTSSIAYSNRKTIYAQGAANTIYEMDRGRTGERISATLKTINEIKSEFEQEIAKNQETQIELSSIN